MSAREYVINRLNGHNLNGIYIEQRLFDRTSLALPGKAGWDYYEFRKTYKRLCVRLLENLSFQPSSLLESLKTEQTTIDQALELDHRLWEAARWKEVQNLVHETNDEIVHEGMYPCGYCRSKKMYALNTTDYAQQTRSADEPMTVFLHCHTCGRNYKFSS